MGFGPSHTRYKNTVRDGYMVEPDLAFASVLLSGFLFTVPRSGSKAWEGNP